MGHFREMEHLRREIDHTLSDLTRGRFLEPGYLPGLGRGRYPQVNICEDENNIYVSALVPGIDPQGGLSVMRRILTQRRASEGKTSPGTEGSGAVVSSLEAWSCLMRWVRPGWKPCAATGCLR